MEVNRVQHNKQYKQKAERLQKPKTEQPGAYAAMLDQKVEQDQQLKTEQPGAYAAMLDQKAEQYQQLKTEQPGAYAAKLNQKVGRYPRGGTSSSRPSAQPELVSRRPTPRS